MKVDGYRLFGQVLPYLALAVLLFVGWKMWQRSEAKTDALIATADSAAAVSSQSVQMTMAMLVRLDSVVKQARQDSVRAAEAAKEADKQGQLAADAKAALAGATSTRDSLDKALVVIARQSDQITSLTAAYEEQKKATGHLLALGDTLRGEVDAAKKESAALAVTNRELAKRLNRGGCRIPIVGGSCTEAVTMALAVVAIVTDN